MTKPLRNNSPTSGLKITPAAQKAFGSSGALVGDWNYSGVQPADPTLQRRLSEARPATVLSHGGVPPDLLPLTQLGGDGIEAPRDVSDGVRAEHEPQWW